MEYENEPGLIACLALVIALFLVWGAFFFIMECSVLGFDYCIEQIKIAIKGVLE